MSERSTVYFPTTQYDHLVVDLENVKPSMFADLEQRIKEVLGAHGIWPASIADDPE